MRLQNDSDNLREFVRTSVILTPAREGGRFRPAVRGQDPQDPQDLEAPVECHFCFDFETPIELADF